MHENLRIALQVLGLILLIVAAYIAGYQDGDYPRRQAVKKRGVRR